MGAHESKVVIDVLSRAYSVAAEFNKDKIEVTLSDPEFLQSLQQLWTNIPRETQKRIIGKSDTERRRKLPKYSHSTVRLSEGFMEQIPLWKQDPMLFFKDKSELVLTHDPLGQLNIYMMGLDKRSGMGVVRFRILQVIYYRLKIEKLGVSQLRSNDAKRLAHIVSQSGLPRDPGVPDPQVSLWVDQGKRIDELCRGIGSVQKIGYSHLANLFFLQDVADSTIKRLPMQGRFREETIQVFKDQNQLCIKDKRCLEDLANSLIDVVWEKLSNSISKSDFGWELRQVQSFQVYDSTHSLGSESQASVPRLPAPQGNTMSESIIHDIELSASSTEFTGSLGPVINEVDHSRLQRDSLDRSVTASEQSTSETYGDSRMRSPCFNELDLSWDSLIHNMSTGVFDIVSSPFGMRRETWNEPSLSSSDTPSASGKLTSSGNVFSSPTISDAHPVSLDAPDVPTNDQLYDMCATIFDTSNGPWDRPLPVFDASPTLTLDSPDSYGMNLAGLSGFGNEEAGIESTSRTVNSDQAQGSIDILSMAHYAPCRSNLVASVV